MIYVDSSVKSELLHLSPLVCGALRHRDMGVTVPKVVVTSSTQTLLIAKMPYLRLVTPQAYPSIAQRVQKGQEATSPKLDSTVTPIWYHQGGFSTYHGAFAKLVDDTTLYITINSAGKTAEIPLKQLSAGAQKYARAMEMQRVTNEQKKHQPDK